MANNNTLWIMKYILKPNNRRSATHGQLATSKLLFYALLRFQWHITHLIIIKVPTGISIILYAPHYIGVRVQLICFDPLPLGLYASEVNWVDSMCGAW